MKQSIFTLIIPFYNEGKQLLEIVEAVLKVNLIKQIILVDDGSTNNISETIKGKFKELDLIKLNENGGKSTAIKSALEKVESQNVVMLDADYQNIVPQELEKILFRYTNSDIDMLLLKVGGGNNWFDRLLRKEILFTGFRVLATNDLKKVFINLNPKGYQLEVAINEYMHRNNKKVAWLPTSVLNIHKSQKWGKVNGFLRSIRMELSILHYLGLNKFLRQVFLFANRKLT